MAAETTTLTIDLRLDTTAAEEQVIALAEALGLTITRPEPRTSRPPVVCICGSTRFRSEITEANYRETIAGRIVLAPGVYGHDGDPMTEEDKVRLDQLHFAKIDLADEILVVDPDGYIGQSTAREITYAHEHGKPVRYTSKEN